MCLVDYSAEKVELHIFFLLFLLDLLLFLDGFWRSFLETRRHGGLSCQTHRKEECLVASHYIQCNHSRLTTHPTPCCGKRHLCGTTGIATGRGCGTTTTTSAATATAATASGKLAEATGDEVVGLEIWSTAEPLWLKWGICSLWWILTCLIRSDFCIVYIL